MHYILWSEFRQRAVFLLDSRRRSRHTYDITCRQNVVTRMTPYIAERIFEVDFEKVDRNIYLLHRNNSVQW